MLIIIIITVILSSILYLILKTPSNAQEPTIELIKNGNFSLDSNNWTFYNATTISDNNSTYNSNKIAKINGNYGNYIKQGSTSPTDSNYLGLWEAGYTYTVQVVVRKADPNDINPTNIEIRTGYNTQNTVENTYITGSSSSIISRLITINMTETKTGVNLPIFIHIKQLAPATTNATMLNSVMNIYYVSIKKTKTV
jgi:hypothetical protein